MKMQYYAQTIKSQYLIRTQANYMKTLKINAKIPEDIKSTQESSLCCEIGTRDILANYKGYITPTTTLIREPQEEIDKNSLTNVFTLWANQREFYTI